MLKNTTLFGVTLLTALTAGLFFAYSCSVNPGLHLLPDLAYLSAMQSINRVILNPVFFVCFFGPVFLLPLSTWQHYTPKPSSAFWYIFFAMVLYLGGVFGVTLFGNVPLNQALEAAQINNASPQDLATYRRAFEEPWNSFHLVRTIASILSFALLLAGLFARKR